MRQLWPMRVLFSTRFSSEDVSAQNQVKASVQRKIRQSIAEEVQLPVDSYILCFNKMFEELIRNLIRSLIFCSIQDLSWCWMTCFRRSPLSLLLNGSWFFLQIFSVHIFFMATILPSISNSYFWHILFPYLLLIVKTI